MEVKDILRHWRAFTEPNNEQEGSSLLRCSLELSLCNQRIEEMLQTYDHSGNVAAVYAKAKFVALLKERSVRLYDIFSQPEAFEKLSRMWGMFTSQEMRTVELMYLDMIHNFVQQATGTMLGTRNMAAEQTTLMESICAVVEELRIAPGACNEDLYRRGGTFLPIQKVSTHIQVYPRLGECLIALEQAPDGAYVCYISDDGSVDGYFGFFLKSNGNLLSVNERIDEPYPGARSNRRNGCWSSTKKYRLFPYTQVITFSEPDRPGEAKRKNIVQEKLDFLTLGPDAYMPMLLALSILSKRYEGCTSEDVPLVYTDALMPINISATIASGKPGLAVPANDVIVLNHRELTMDFTPEAVLDGSLAWRYSMENNNSKCTKMRARYNCGVFNNKNQMMVDMYGAGFQFDPAALLKSDDLALPEGDTEKHRPVGEFVGPRERMEMLAYYNVRRQLADYMRERIHDEYVAFGGVDAVRKWWKDALLRHTDTIHTMVVRRFSEVSARQETTSQLPFKVRFAECCDPHAVGVSWDFVLSPDDGKFLHPKYRCPITGASVSYIFGFHPATWTDLANLIGEELPKIVVGWKAAGHDSSGNSLLDACDAVDSVGTPFEPGQSACPLYGVELSPYRDRIGPAVFNFAFAVAYSKSGMKKLIKQYGKELSDGSGNQ